VIASASFEKSRFKKSLKKKKKKKRKMNKWTIRAFTGSKSSDAF